MDTLVEIYKTGKAVKFIGATRTLSFPMVGDVLTIDNDKEANGTYIVESRVWVNGFGLLKVYVKED